MNTTNDIKKFLLRNSIITYGMCGVAIVAMLLNFFSTQKAIDESRKYLYMIKTDGEVVPMEWIERRDNMTVEVKHHISMFVDNFYTLNQYNWEERVEKALWLGDFKNLHIRRLNEGFYNRFIQFGVEQRAMLFPESIELVQENGQIVFRIMINLSEKIDNVRYNYTIFAKGNVQMTTREFPLNPHGLFITNYIEEKVIKEE